jgi:drug/metabolite transporter (DMT)-like permease
MKTDSYIQKKVLSMVNRFYLGAFFVFLSASGFAMIPIFATFAYRAEVSVFTLLFLRFLLAAVFFLLYLFAGKKHRWKSGSKIPYFPLFILGGVLYTFQSLTFFSSVKYIPSALASLLLYTFPIFVALLSYLIDKERLTVHILASIALSIGGLALAMGKIVGEINPLGVVLALSAAVCYSLYIVIGNRVVKQLSPVVTTTFVTVFATVSFFFIGLSTGSLTFRMSGQGWAAVAATALVCTILSLVTFFRGLELIGSTKASILSMLEPVVTIGLAFLLLGERLTWLQMLGACAVISGAIWIVAGQGRQKQQPRDGQQPDTFMP